MLSARSVYGGAPVSARAGAPAAGPARVARLGVCAQKESLVGKKPVPVPKGVTVTIQNNLLTATARRAAPRGPLAPQPSRQLPGPSLTLRARRRGQRASCRGSSTRRL